MNRKRLVTWLLVAAMLIAGMPVSLAEDEPELVQSDAPNADNCVVYNYAMDSDLAPTLYVWNAGGNMTYRVYNSNPVYGAATLLGSARTQTYTNSCTIGLRRDAIGEYGGSVYVTCQASGELESDAVAVAYTKAATPYVKLTTYLPGSKVQDGTELIAYSKQGDSKMGMAALKAGSYYIVEIALENFTKLQSVTIPIKYDPTIFQLVKPRYGAVGATYGYTFKGSSPVSTPESGTYITSFSNYLPHDAEHTYMVEGAPSYGIGVYPNLYYWGATQSTTITSAEAQTPYVNTRTGLIKLELYTESTVNDISHLEGAQTTDSMHRPVVRLFFKCLRTATEEEAANEAKINPTAIHFATTADIPDDATEDTAQRYYCTTSPNGCTAYIQAMNLLAPPPTMITEHTGTEMYAMSAMNPVQLYALPSSITESEICTLLQNRVKIYNFTNYSNNSGAGVTYQGIDSEIDDILLLTPSGGVNGAAQPGDIVYVYQDGNPSPIASGTANQEGGVKINLGKNNLDPNGGSVFLTVKRGILDETTSRVEIPYAAEAKRNVFFKVQSSGFHGTEGMPINGSNFYVNNGDQITLDVYFDDFEELMSFAFRLNFDPHVVQAADQTFHILQKDRYITEEELLSGESCIKIGDDVSQITVTERLLYGLWETYLEDHNDEAALESAAALGVLDLAALKDAYDAVALKMAINGESGRKGGLLFTGDVRNPGTNGANDPGRDEDSLFPYVNNTTGELRVSFAELVRPPISLHSADGSGYHFLRLYFVGIGSSASGDPVFTLDGGSSTTSGRNAEGGEKVTSRTGHTELVITGPASKDKNGDNYAVATNAAVPFMAYWNAYSIEKIPKTAIIRLKNGNAKKSDGDPAAVYLYNGCAFRDPGFVLLSQNDVPLIDTGNGTWNPTVSGGISFSRYFMDSGGNRVELPWTEEEVITRFKVPNGQYSATYDLIYEYVYADPNDVGQTITVTSTRKIYVIFRLGDLNGDGNVNLFDEQFLVDMEQSGDTSYETDSLYMSMTYLERSELHALLFGPEGNADEYDMPVEPAIRLLGDGSKDTNDFRLYLEFYPANANPESPGMPLDVDKLPAGKNVIAVLRYENMPKLVTDGGMHSIGISLGYDSDYYTLNGFKTRSADGTALWDDQAYDLNAAWSTWTAPLYEEYGIVSASVDAVDRVTKPDPKEEKYVHEIYIQYLCEMMGAPVFAEAQGVLAAFSFTVKNEVFQDKYFYWLDYGIATVDGISVNNPEVTSMAKEVLLDNETTTSHFQKPTLVTTASTIQEEPTGYSITGEVTSYNAANPITYELYKLNETTNVYESTAAYSGILVEAETSGGVSGQHTQAFEITKIGGGTYKLVITKAAHLNFVIQRIKVDDSDVNLKLDSRERARNILMGAGDINGDGSIGFDDDNVIFDISNFGKKTSDASVNLLADVNGDGTIGFDDDNIIFDLVNFGKQAKDYVI